MLQSADQLFLYKYALRFTDFGAKIFLPKTSVRFSLPYRDPGSPKLRIGSMEAKYGLRFGGGDWTSLASSSENI